MPYCDILLTYPAESTAPKHPASQTDAFFFSFSIVLSGTDKRVEQHQKKAEEFTKVKNGPLKQARTHYWYLNGFLYWQTDISRGYQHIKSTKQL